MRLETAKIIGHALDIHGLSLVALQAGISIAVDFPSRLFPESFCKGRELKGNEGCKQDPL